MKIRKCEIGNWEDNNAMKSEVKQVENVKINESQIKGFEDLEVYQLAREFRKRIYKVTRKLPKEEKYNLFGQMRRAAVSLTDNIAEGYGRYHFKENIQFCRQSRGSLCELTDDLNICIDESYILEDEYNSHRKDAFRLLKVLNSYIAKTGEMQREYLER